MLTGTYIREGALPILLGSTCWAVGYFLRKYIVGGIDALTITFLASASAVISLYAIKPVKLSVLYICFLNNWKMIVPISVLGVTIGSTLMTFGLQYIDLGIAVVLGKIQPLFTVLIAGLFLKETLARRSIFLGIIAILSSIGLILPMNHLTSFPSWSLKATLGSGSIIATAFFWAITQVMGRKLLTGNVDSTMLALLRCFIGAVTTLPLMAFFDFRSLPSLTTAWTSYVLACLIGTFGTGVGLYAYYRGLKVVSAGVASMLDLATPIIGVLLGITFFHEHMTIGRSICGFTLLSAVTWLLWIESRRNLNLAK